MNSIHITLLIIFGFILIMTLILNKVEKDRIPLMGDFFGKVLPRMPKIKFGKKGKDREKRKIPPDDNGGR